MANLHPRPAVLCILDGWGFRPDPRDNAILDARTPNYDRLVSTCPQSLIDASETFVGLPKGQMGNSEVGHMNLGAGRVAVPELPRIDTAIEDGSLAKNPLLAKIRSGLTRKVLSELTKKAKEDPDSYLTFWQNFGAVLKEGLYEDFERRDTLLGLARFKSTASDQPTRQSQCWELISATEFLKSDNAVDCDAVVADDAGLLRELLVRQDADTDHDDVGGEALAVAGDDGAGDGPGLRPGGEEGLLRRPLLPRGEGADVPPPDGVLARGDGAGLGRDGRGPQARGGRHLPRLPGRRGGAARRRGRDGPKRQGEPGRAAARRPARASSTCTPPPSTTPRSTWPPRGPGRRAPSPPRSR